MLWFEKQKCVSQGFIKTADCIDMVACPSSRTISRTLWCGTSGINGQCFELETPSTKKRCHTKWKYVRLSRCVHFHSRNSSSANWALSLCLSLTWFTIQFTFAQSRKKNFISESLIHTAQCYAKCVIVGVCVCFSRHTAVCSMTVVKRKIWLSVKWLKPAINFKWFYLWPIWHWAMGIIQQGAHCRTAAVAVCFSLLCRRSVWPNDVACARTAHGHSSHSNLHTTIIIYFMRSSVLVSHARSRTHFALLLLLLLLL